MCCQKLSYALYSLYHSRQEITISVVDPDPDPNPKWVRTQQLSGIHGTDRIHRIKNWKRNLTDGQKFTVLTQDNHEPLFLFSLKKKCLRIYCLEKCLQLGKMTESRPKYNVF